MVASMGIHVHLAVIADRVPDAAWRAIYDRACRVAKEWIPRPLSIGWRQIGAVRVAQYCHDLETAEGLCIVGDAESLTTADRFELPARLDRTVAWRDPGAADDDVLVAVARWMGAGTAPRVPWCELLGRKTQGLPYHALVVALGLVVEHALPGLAAVFGDVSVRGGEQARRGVASILGEEVELPVVVDPERLRRRLAAGLSGGALDEAVRQLGPCDPYLEAKAGDVLGLLRRTPGARVRHELEHAVLACPDPDGLDAGTRHLLRELVGTIRASIVRWELRARIEQRGAIATREALARRTLASGMCLTSMAWDAIEAADLDELAFLYMAACVDTHRLEVHQAVRAVLENRALRRA